MPDGPRGDRRHDVSRGRVERAGPAPDFGDASEQVLSPAEERALGEAFMREVRSRLTIVEDPQVEEYVQSLGYRLVAASDRRHLGFTFFVVEDESVNAFAAPDGFVGVNSGLILATRTESELASVLAHEVAHVTQRHIARAIADADRMNIPTLAAIAAAILVGAGNTDVGQAAAATVIGSTVQRRINFTRRNEMEADRVGIRMLAGAGFDPREMARFFEKLQNASRYSGALPNSSPHIRSPRTASRRPGTAPIGSRTSSTRARSRTTSSAPSCACASPTTRKVCSISSSRNAPPVMPGAPPPTPMDRRSR